MEELNSLYQLIKSRNELTVPVIRGVHLHSKYNPIKEAKAFANGFADSIAKKNHILVFGLGFGYHIDEIANLCTQLHQHYEIRVIEPNKKLVEDFCSIRPFENSNIKIICEESTNHLFETTDFVQFLLKKPCIIKHDSSFNLQKEYYSKFLTYTASTNIEDYIHLLNRTELTNYFKTSRENSLDNVHKSIKHTGRVNCKNDLAILAMTEIIKQNQITTRDQHD